MLPSLALTAGLCLLAATPSLPAEELQAKPDSTVEAAADQAADPAAEAVVESELSSEQKEIVKAAVAKPVSAEPIQIFGWREHVMIKGAPETVIAKLDTGARTSSIHVEKDELFERDGRKWVRFIFTDPTKENSFRVKIEAPLVRVVEIKEPGGQSVPREVVKLGIQIGDRKLSGEFTLNNRSNMLAPVLIGRTMLQELGLVDPGRTHLAEEKVFR